MQKINLINHFSVTFPKPKNRNQLTNPSLFKAKNIITEDQLNKIVTDVEENEDLESNTDRDKQIQNAVSRHIYHGFAKLHKIPVEKRKYFKDSVNEKESEDKM